MYDNEKITFHMTYQLIHEKTEKNFPLLFYSYFYGYHFNNHINIQEKITINYNCDFSQQFIILKLYTLSL